MRGEGRLLSPEAPQTRIPQLRARRTDGGPARVAAVPQPVVTSPRPGPERTRLPDLHDLHAGDRVREADRPVNRYPAATRTLGRGPGVGPHPVHAKTPRAVAGTHRSGRSHHVPGERDRPAQNSGCSSAAERSAAQAFLDRQDQAAADHSLTPDQRVPAVFPRWVRRWVATLAGGSFGAACARNRTRTGTARRPARFKLAVSAFHHPGMARGSALAHEPIGALPSFSGTLARCCLILLTSEGASVQVGPAPANCGAGRGRKNRHGGMTETRRLDGPVWSIPPGVPRLRGPVIPQEESRAVWSDSSRPCERARGRTTGASTFDTMEWFPNIPR